MGGPLEKRQQRVAGAEAPAHTALDVLDLGMPSALLATVIVCIPEAHEE
jgi:hypothetical protein